MEKCSSGLLSHSHHSKLKKSCSYFTMASLILQFNALLHKFLWSNHYQVLNMQMILTFANLMYFFRNDFLNEWIRIYIIHMTFVRWFEYQSNSNTEYNNWLRWNVPIFFCGKKSTMPSSTLCFAMYKKKNPIKSGV